MIVQARLGTGYGDFVNLLTYIRNCNVKYGVDTELVLHFPYPVNYRVSNDDPETVIERVNIFNSVFDENSSVKISIKANSNFPYRFINMLDEWDFRHGLYNLKNQYTSIPNKVVHWNSCSNTYFPGHEKDPFYYQWKSIVYRLKQKGYDVVEITYRTPFKEALYHIKTCEFGIGYDGMVHQLFKCYDIPLIVLATRKTLNEILVPHAYIISDPNSFKINNIDKYVDVSVQKRVQNQIDYKRFLNEQSDPTIHRLYNTPIY